MVAVVPDDHLSLAIGKNGHNVRLAGELVSCRIDIETQSLWEENRRWEEMLRVDASEIPGISDNVLEKLRLAGYDSANSIAEASEADLLDVHGVGPVRAAQLMVEAKRLAEARKADVERLKAEAEAGAGAQAAEDTSTSPEKGGTDD